MKKTVSIFTLMGILLVSGVATQAIAAPNEKAQNPDLEKIVFIHYYKPNHESDPDCDISCEGNDDDTTFQLISGGIKWSTLPIEYTISNEFSPAEITAIKNSAETWDDGLDFKSGNSINLFVDNPSLTTKTAAHAGDNDGENIIVMGDLPSGIIGQTSFWYNTGTKEIIDADMILNTDYDWSTTTQVGDPYMDIQNIVTHELGHYLALNDLQSPKTSGLTMYGFGTEGEIKDRTLGLGDELGVTQLYGGASGGTDEGGPDCSKSKSQKWCP